jgi:hypothetical protein
MRWIPTTYGAVSERFVIRVERDSGGTLFHLVDGNTARSPMLFDVIDGELTQIEPIDDDCPFSPGAKTTS